MISQSCARNAKGIPTIVPCGRARTRSTKAGGSIPHRAASPGAAGRRGGSAGGSKCIPAAASSSASAGAVSASAAAPAASALPGAGTAAGSSALCIKGTRSPMANGRVGAAWRHLLQIGCRGSRRAPHPSVVHMARPHSVSVTCAASGKASPAWPMEMWHIMAARWRDGPWHRGQATRPSAAGPPEAAAPLPAGGCEVGRARGRPER